MKFKSFLKTAVDCARTTFKGFADHRCGLHAAGLTYFSMMALVPVLCLLLLLAKTCGAGDYVRAQLNARLDASISRIENGQDDDVAKALVADTAQAEERRRNARGFAIQARELSNELLDRAERFDAGTLGWVGLVLLLWTVVSTLGTVEMTFNEIWGVARPRPIWKRAYLFLLVSLVLPVLVAVAMSMPLMKVAAAVIDNTVGLTDFTRPVSEFIKAALVSRAFSFAFTLFFAAASFAFFFGFMPHTRVNRRAAVEGGFATALVFGGWMKICAVAQVGIAKSNALYGSFAFLPIVLAWIYMSWQVILLGANFVYALDGIHSGARARVRG